MAIETYHIFHGDVGGQFEKFLQNLRLIIFCIVCLVHLHFKMNSIFGMIFPQSAHFFLLHQSLNELFVILCPFIYGQFLDIDNPVMFLIEF